MHSPPVPAQQRQLLRDGYWDRTAVMALPDGSKRVRKISKGVESAGPWGMDNLRAEAHYLATLEASLHDFFPPLLGHWDTDTTGYDMGYMENYVDVGKIAQQQVFNQPQADAMQAYLGLRILAIVNTHSGPS